METLKLKHVACYLPYGLKIQTQDKNGILIKTVDGIYEQYKDGSFMLYWQENYGTIQASGNIKLILRPLSDLKNNFESIDLYTDLCSTYNGVVINDIIDNKRDTSFISYYYIERLLQNHFDIFGLIEKNLAIDINTL